MLKYLSWRVVIGVVVVALSAFFHLIHCVIFCDAHPIFINRLGDIAFVSFEVLLFTIIIDRLLHEREKRSLLDELNMTIGIFISEDRNEILGFLAFFDTQADRLREDFLVTDRCSREDFLALRKRVNACEHRMGSRLISKWPNTIWHLRYPFLISLAMRTHPFDPIASVEVHEKGA